MMSIDMNGKVKASRSYGMNAKQVHYIDDFMAEFAFNSSYYDYIYNMNQKVMLEQYHRISIIAMICGLKKSHMTGFQYDELNRYGQFQIYNLLKYVLESKRQFYIFNLIQYVLELTSQLVYQLKMMVRPYVKYTKSAIDFDNLDKNIPFSDLLLSWSYAFLIYETVYKDIYKIHLVTPPIEHKRYFSLNDNSIISFNLQNVKTDNRFANFNKKNKIERK